MSKSSALLELGSSSMSLLGNKKDSFGDDHFKWQSIQKFIYFASIYAINNLNFDIFSNVKLTDFLLVESTIGIGYMCLDSFIKQYTRRFDCGKYMSPLLRGITYGKFMQTAMFVVLHASYLADSMRFLVASFHAVPPWALCANGDVNSSCVSTKDIILRCKANKTTDFASTSAAFHYLASFTAVDRNTLTTRYFILGVVWMLVFFVSSVTEETIVKVFKLSFMIRNISTVVTLLFLIVSTKDNIGIQAFSEIMDISAPGNIMNAVRHVIYGFGIGFLGLYDFGTMSPYTMIDTAVVIFLCSFTIFAILRSLLVRMLILILIKCVKLPGKMGTHRLFFSVLPLSTEFLNAHKLYVFYVYGNVLIGTLVYMTNLILILSKFLSYEFRSMKIIYIIGLLCFVGLGLSIPYLGVLTHLSREGDRAYIIMGIDTITPYLGGYYVAIVMWLYGLEKFCTDIQFWLGFRPTRFWTVTWSLIPVALFGFTIERLYTLSTMNNRFKQIVAGTWAGLTFLVVAFLQIKSATGYVMKNNLAGLFKSNKNYGPPELEDRKRRLYYSEYTRRRTCKHNCLVIDEWFDCNHQVLAVQSKASVSESSSDPSLMNIYDAKSRLKSVGAISGNVRQSYVSLT